jgi:hypothetical protein
MISRLMMAALVWTSAYVSVASAQSAQEYVDWTPIHEGGSQWVIRPGAFELWNNGLGVLGDNGFSLRATDQILAGCYIKTPWLPVAQASDVVVFPGVNVVWTGTVGRSEAVDVGVTTINVETRGLDGRVRRQAFDLSTGELDLRVVVIDDAQHLTYRGSVNTGLGMPGALTYALQVGEPSEMRITMCNLFEDSRIDVRDVAIQVLPKR